MFILIPLILIFLASSYLYINENLAIYSQLFIYGFIIFIIFISIYIIKIIKSDLKKQELNNIQLEIEKLEKKLLNITDDIAIQGIKNEIDILIREYKKKKLFND